MTIKEKFKETIQSSCQPPTSWFDVEHLLSELNPHDSLLRGYIQLEFSKNRFFFYFIFLMYIYLRIHTENFISFRWIFSKLQANLKRRFRVLVKCIPNFKRVFLKMVFSKSVTNITRKRLDRLVSTFNTTFLNIFFSH